MALANPPLDAGWLTFFALVPLLLSLRDTTPARGALLGLAFGLVSFGALLAWLRPFGLIAWLPLVVVESLYVAVFGALWSILRGRGSQPWRGPLAAGALWTALEWVRATWPIGGFTWGGLGYTQHANPFLLPLASVTGVWGVAFVIVLVDALILEVVSGSVRRWGRGVALAAAAAAVLGPALIPLPPAAGRAVDVAVVQGNVPKALASDLLLHGDTVEANEISLHRTLAGDAPDLAVWPENSLDEDPRLNPRLQARIAGAVRTVGAPTLVGGVRSVDGRLYNTIFAYAPDGRIVGAYDKVHLVPFGEYVPFTPAFRWTEGLRRGNADFTPGSRIRVFHIAGTTVGTPICFENAFPGLFRTFVAKGARLVIVTTNDSSFLRAPTSREHVEFSQLRAVETARWVVQAAVSGESAVVDPRGRIVARTGLFTREILRFDVPTSSATTLYVRLGDWFPWACGVACVLGLAWVAGTGERRRRRAADAPPAGERGGAEASRPQHEHAPIAGGAEPRTLVILPTFNERATITTVACAILALGPSIDVLVVDDGSPDGTGDVVADLAERETRVRLMRRPEKLGLASAYLTGFARAMEEGYDLAVEMDADLSHQPTDLPRLLEGATRNDLTIGSRYVPGGAVSNWSRGRLLLSRAGNAYARAALGIPVRDSTSGFRVFRASLLRWLLAQNIRSDGYAFQVEVAYRAWGAGYRVGEVPISFREREHGKSKLSRRIVLEALVRIGQWGFRDRLGRPPSS